MLKIPRFPNPAQTKYSPVTPVRLFDFFAIYFTLNLTLRKSLHHQHK